MRRVLGWTAVCLGLGWLAAVGMMWMAGTSTSGIHVRWTAVTSPEQQLQVAKELKLECERSVGDRTFFCAVLDPQPAVLERVVRHPAVDDTHYLNRGTFVLENPPTATTRLWAGRESPIVGSVGVMLSAGLLALVGGYLLMGRRQ